MRDPGVGRSAGLTDWYLMNVADMWACLQDHHTDNHWRHVAGWRKVCELAGQHLGRLRTYRESLARVWPPETNEASRAYIAELDALIDQVQRTHDAAAANQTALSAATQAISSSRTEIKKIYDEYAGKLQQKRSWEETAADPKAVLGSRASQPPVTDSDLERLNIQARGIMYGLSGELQQAQLHLRHPPPTKPSVRDGASPDAYGGGAAPIIPPIMPVPLPSTGTSIAKQPGSVPPLVPKPTALAVGPVLGEAGPQLAAQPASPMAPSTPPASPTTLRPAPSEGAPPFSGIIIRPVSPRLGQESRPIGKGANTVPNTNPPKAMPPGGIIGGSPGLGFGHSGPESARSRQINPIGGIIGGGAAGTAPTGGAGSRPGRGRGPGATHGLIGVPTTPTLPSGVGLGPPPRANRHNRGSEDDTHRWDPDHPWEVEPGVNPVVRPPDEEGPVDPGPAIGLNR
ncbi:hypothetical protein O7615_05485 [Micromonospora sp. WMMD1082]|nr:hypothetical protein [Micromonospora sp. WMMD1082]MDG4793334.1 hypothetical protein [Micromonospora sp. WMMD1082]